MVGYFVATLSGSHLASADAGVALTRRAATSPRELNAESEPFKRDIDDTPLPIFVDVQTDPVCGQMCAIGPKQKACHFDLGRSVDFHGKMGGVRRDALTYICLRCVTESG